MGWLHPKEREETSAAIRTGRVIYWALSGVSFLIHFAGLVGSAILFFGDEAKWWLPFVVALVAAIVVGQIGRAARYILSDE